MNLGSGLSLRELIPLLGSEDIELVLQTILKNPLALPKAYQCLFCKLKGPDFEEKSKAFCLQLLMKFAIRFRIPAVLELNKSNYVQVLRDYAKIDIRKKVQVESVIGYCVALFPPHDHSSIQHIADLWNELHSSLKITPIQENVRFTKLFCQSQTLLSASENFSQLSDKDKQELSDKLTIFLTKVDFKDSTFNVWEKDLALSIRKKLTERMAPIVELEMKTYLDRMEIKPQSQTQNHLRTCFVLKEKLNEDENASIEYKNFIFPFIDAAKQALKKAICAFLNRRGGRIYLGVDDMKNVVGIKLNLKQRDTMKTSILCFLQEFEPQIRANELVKIVSLPIMDPKNNQKIPGRFVIKIIVKPGDPTKLYSASKDECRFYMRNDGQSIAMNPREVAEAILERSKMLEPSKQEDRFDDPDPEELIDVEQFMKSCQCK